MLQYLPLSRNAPKRSNTRLIDMQHLLQDFQNNSDHSGASRNKGLTSKHENVLCWLDND